MTRNNHSPEKIIASLDIGTNKIVCAIVKSENKDFQILGLGYTKISAKNLTCTDMGIALKASIEKAELSAGVTVNSVILGATCEHVIVSQSRAIVKPFGAINQENIEEVIGRASESNSSKNDIIHILPESFYIDDVFCAGNPIGLVANNLEVIVNIMTLNHRSISPLLKIIQNAGYAVSNIILKPLAAAQILLSQEIKEQGCLLLDIGEDLTEYLVFLNGCVKSFGEISLAGSYITKDLAYGLKQSWDIAEQIKCEHGAALSHLVSDTEQVKILSNKFSEYWELKKNIVEIIQPRLEEILFLIDEILGNKNIKPHLRCGVIMTGGVSNTQNIEILAKEIFQLPVHKGKIPHEVHLDKYIKIENYAVAIGLAAYEANYEYLEKLPIEQFVGEKKMRSPSKLQTWLGEFF